MTNDKREMINGKCPDPTQRIDASKFRSSKSAIAFEFLDLLVQRAA
jgi:hypothetical protein